MKKTWSILCAAVVLTFSLAGCANDKTQGSVNAPSASPSASPSSASPSAMPSQEIHGTAESGDLAGQDGVVDGDGTTGGVGNTDNDKTGQADNSALEEVGEGVRDTLDDMGDAARDMGRDARNAIERH